MPAKFALNTKQKEATSTAVDLLRSGETDRYEEVVTESDGEQFKVSAYWAVEEHGGIRIDIESVV